MKHFNNFFSETELSLFLNLKIRQESSSLFMGERLLFMVGCEQKKTGPNKTIGSKLT